MNLQVAETLARGLMMQYGLEDWTFSFDRATRRFGATYQRRRLITISEKLTALNEEKHVKDVILHEIAHALTDPEESSHGEEWKYNAKMVGCNPLPHYSSEVVKPILKPRTIYIGHCPNCHRIIRRTRRMNIGCGVCCKRFNNDEYSDAYKIEWK